jgi:hypothetical protein
VERFDDPSGAGLLKPFATALVLMVWALLFGYVSRRASRAALDDELLRVEVEQPA